MEKHPKYVSGERTKEQLLKVFLNTFQVKQDDAQVMALCTQILVLNRDSEAECPKHKSVGSTWINSAAVSS